MPSPRDTRGRPAPRAGWRPHPADRLRAGALTPLAEHRPVPTSGDPDAAGTTSWSRPARGTDLHVSLNRVHRSFRGRSIGALIPLVGPRTLGRQLESVLRQAEAPW